VGEAAPLPCVGVGGWVAPCGCVGEGVYENENYSQGGGVGVPPLCAAPSPHKPPHV
jgi:hypothetical protein